MNRQEFLAKYDNTVICITTRQVLNDRKHHDELNMFNYIIRDLNLQHTMIANPLAQNYELWVAVYTKAVEANVNTIRFTFQHFLLDYKSIEQLDLDELKETVKMLLSDLNITTKTVTKLND